MEIYRIVIHADNGNGITHAYMAANTNLEAFIKYINITNMDVSDFNNGRDYIRMVTEWEYDDYEIYSDETETNKITIGEYFKSMEHPDIICEFFNRQED